MKLVVVESPSKAKTIEKYLGKDYKVIASKGHVVDLPKSAMGVDFDNKYEPAYEVTKPKELSQIKKLYRQANELVIATDLDREGEAIGWHIARELGALKKNSKKNLSRITFSEITKDAIAESINQPREIDMQLVNAQEARRILDRIVGYKLSPLLWKKIRYGLSAGRVQSAALRLIVERELEREAFIPQEYWDIKILASKEKSSKSVKNVIVLQSDDKEKKDLQGKFIKLNLQSIKPAKKLNLEKQTEVETVLNKLKDEIFEVKDISSNVIKKYPKPPFTTSTLQQAAANKLGFAARRTMQIAQKLYEAGHITYMRTDSLNISNQAIEQIRSYLPKEYGAELLNPKVTVFAQKSKSAQEAHEAIRPTNVAKTSGQLKLTGEEEKLYNMIRQRTIATQANPAQITQTKLTAESEHSLASTNFQAIKFKGYLAIYHEQVTEDEPLDTDVKVGDLLYPHENIASQHFTEPKARYTEATLIKTLEQNGVGRPSTYASTIATLLARKYIEKLAKALVPTDIGRIVNKLLTDHFDNIINIEFTSDMELQLDKIAEGGIDWINVIDKFYKPFATLLTKTDKDIKRADYTILGEAPDDVICPKCGAKMQIKLGKFGKFYSCSKFPDCDGILAMPGQNNPGEPAETPEALAETYEPAPKTEDGRDYLLKKGRFGSFWAHPDYPKVKDAQPLVMKKEALAKLWGEPPKTQDGRDYLLKKGRFGSFWAHPDYPKVKDIIRAKQKKVA